MTLRHLLLAGLFATSAAFAPAANHAAARSPSSALSMVAVDTSDIKNGLTIELDGEPYKVLSFSIMKQARGAAKTTIKFKNLKRGNTLENTYRSGEKFETAQIDKTPSQYTYEDEVRSIFEIIASFVIKLVGWVPFLRFWSQNGSQILRHLLSSGKLHTEN